MTQALHQQPAAFPQGHQYDTDGVTKVILWDGPSTIKFEVTGPEAAIQEYVDGYLVNYPCYAYGTRVLDIASVNGHRIVRIERFKNAE